MVKPLRYKIVQISSWFPKLTVVQSTKTKYVAKIQNQTVRTCFFLWYQVFHNRRFRWCPTTLQDRSWRREKNSIRTYSPMDRIHEKSTVLIDVLSNIDHWTAQSADRTNRIECGKTSHNYFEDLMHSIKSHYILLNTGRPIWSATKKTIHSFGRFNSNKKHFLLFSRQKNPIMLSLSIQDDRSWLQYYVASTIFGKF